MAKTPGRSAHVHQEKPPTAVPPVEVPPAQRKGLSTGWRIALFLWVSSFAFLLFYEILLNVFKLFMGSGTAPSP